MIQGDTRSLDYSSQQGFYKDFLVNVGYMDFQISSREGAYP